VAPQEIDRYLAALDEPKRSTLEALRKSIMEIVPEADQGISYGMPAFKVEGKAVAGFAAFKNHLSYMPHSGSVLATLGDDTAAYETSKGSLKFAVDKPLPKRLVKSSSALACGSFAKRPNPRTARQALTTPPRVHELHFVGGRTTRPHHEHISPVRSALCALR
jgi:uncharacterized protein YdhG (YjbR/CyaY superfamily)